MTFSQRNSVPAARSAAWAITATLAFAMPLAAQEPPTSVGPPPVTPAKTPADAPVPAAPATDAAAPDDETTEPPAEAPVQEPTPAPVTTTPAAPGPPPSNKPLESQIPDLAQESQVGLTGIYAAGNVSTLAGTATGYYQVKVMRAHALRLDLTAGVLASGVDDDANPATPLRPLHENVSTLASAKARYDYFLSDHDSVYGSFLGGHDSAANLAARLQAEAGYRHLFGDTPKHQLSLEIGGAYSIDYAPFDAEDTNKDGKVDVWDRDRFENTGGTGGLRLAAAYKVQPVEGLTIQLQAQVLPNIFPFEIEAPFETARFGGDQDDKLGVGGATVASGQADLSFLLMQSLSVTTTIKGIYDAGAIARRNALSNADVLIAVGLTYKLL